MKYVAAALLALSCVGCGHISRDDVRTVVDLADKACVVLDQHTNEQVVEQVCATKEELDPLVDQILASRRMSAAKAGGQSVEEPTKPECPECPACPVPDPPKTEDKPPEPPAKPAE